MAVLHVIYNEKFFTFNLIYKTIFINRKKGKIWRGFFQQYVSVRPVNMSNNIRLSLTKVIAYWIFSTYIFLVPSACKCHTDDVSYVRVLLTYRFYRVGMVCVTWLKEFENISFLCHRKTENYIFERTHKCEHFLR